MDGGHFEDFRWPKFLYTDLFHRLLSYIFQKKSHQTLRPRSCRVNQNFDISWILDLGLLSSQTESSKDNFYLAGLGFADSTESCYRRDVFGNVSYITCEDDCCGSLEDKYCCRKTYVYFFYLVFHLNHCIFQMFIFVGYSLAGAYMYYMFVYQQDFYNISVKKCQQFHCMFR